MYNDNGAYWDEHAFAAAWLHKATGEKKYLANAEKYYWKCCSSYQDVQQVRQSVRTVFMHTSRLTD